MEAVSARINSFKKSKRVKNPDKPSSSATVKWPHPPDFKANPESLAEAGFYYDPAYGDPDNVTCYVCEKELGGWEEDDDPLLLHWTKCGQQCCWASVRCGLAVDLDKSGRFISTDKTRAPTHKSMEKARLETFNVGKGWIHDKVKGHGASSVMMARAGFVYTPQHSEDDLAACLYCGTSLSGWDPDDDPLEEHRTRAARLEFPCLFFSGSKPVGKSQSKPPPRSTSKSNHQDLVLPTKTFDGEGEESDAVETVKPTKSTAKTPRKPRSTTSSTRKSTTKTPKPKARSTSRSGLKGVEEDDEEEAGLEVPVTTKKKAPSRSKHVVQSDVHSDDEEDVEQVPTTVKKKPPSRSKPVSKVQSVVDADEERLEPPPTTKKKSKPKAKKPTIKSNLEPEAESETAEVRKPSRSKTRKVVQESADEDAEDIPRKSSRAKSKTAAPVEAEEVLRKVSRAKAKPSNDVLLSDEEPRKQSQPKSKNKALESEHEDIAEATDIEPPPPTKPRHQRTASKSKSKASAKAEPAEQEEQPVRAVSKKKPSSKSKPSQPLAAGDLFDEGVVVNIEIQSLPSPPPPISLQPSITELAPLFVPKRNTAAASSSSQPPQQTVKVVPKPKPHLQKPVKVVEISSDEESDDSDSSNQVQPTNKAAHNMKPQAFPQPQFSTPPRPASSQSQHRKAVIVDNVQPIEAARSHSPDVVESNNDNDVNMRDVEQDGDEQMNDIPPPSTPPRSMAQSTHVNAIKTVNDSQSEPTPPAQKAPAVASSEPQFVPPLSKLPFAHIQTLADAELDMTVEEWIRYQMDVEFDKFRRDGERELQQFRKKAEDVRKIIEGL